jgi:hypothetical protein
MGIFKKHKQKKRKARKEGQDRRVLLISMTRAVLGLEFS